MVITCENIGFITRRLRPLVINPIFSLVMTITTRNIFQYFLLAIYYYLIALCKISLENRLTNMFYFIEGENRRFRIGPEYCVQRLLQRCWNVTSEINGAWNFDWIQIHNQEWCLGLWSSCLGNLNIRSVLIWFFYNIITSLPRCNFCYLVYYSAPVGWLLVPPDSSDSGISYTVYYTFIRTEYFDIRHELCCILTFLNCPQKWSSVSGFFQKFHTPTWTNPPPQWWNGILG